MRRITRVDNGFSEPDRSFTDHIVMIVSRYLYNVKSGKSELSSFGDLVTSSAKELNWEILSGSRTAVLILHVAKISAYTTPLWREDDWDNALVSAAYAEYKP